MAFGHQGAVSRAGTQLRHSRCWGAEVSQGDQDTLYWQAGPSHWGWLPQGTKKFIHMDKTQALSGCTHGYSCPFPLQCDPTLSHATVCHVSGSGNRAHVRCGCVSGRGSPAAPSELPSHTTGRTRRAGRCCPLAAAPPLQPFAAGPRLQNGRWRKAGRGCLRARGDGRRHTNRTALQMKRAQTPPG